jgi:GT2 family glycosyltransferase
LTGLPSDPSAYRLWVAKYDTPDVKALNAVRKLQGPIVSVIMAAGDTTAEGAVRSAESLRRQIHDHWELIIAFACVATWPRDILMACAAREPRIKLLEVGEHVGLMPEAAGAVSGDLVCRIEAGDLLPPTALHEVAEAFNEHPRAELIFTDEDRLDGTNRCDPRFKAAFSSDAFVTGNAIGQLAVYRRGLFEKAGGIQTAAAPFDDYDLAIRAVRLLGFQGILHLPSILLHRANQIPDWPGQATIPLRQDLGVVADQHRVWPRIVFGLADPPLVSVIVPTRDRADLLATCMSGLLERTEYPRLEVLIIDNGSTDPSAIDLLDRLQQNANVRVFKRPGGFNFAALNNAAAAQAAGEVLLLLNNDIEILRPDWLFEMASHAMRPDVGVVGARLLYPDDTLQHAGLLLGPGGAATHIGRGSPADDPGYDGQFACTRDVSVVTGACLAIRRDVFNNVGGMDERLAVTWNDVDLCLRVRKSGKRVIWTPHAVLRHHESATRGLESDDPAKAARFKQEQALMMEIWGDALEADPYLNPNLLAAENGLLLLAEPPRVKRPWS